MPDGLSGNPRYLARTMLRQLLTLLAVLTGFAATGELAQARAVGVEQVALAMPADECAASRSACVAALAEMPARPATASAMAWTRTPAPAAHAALAPVRLPVDRARE